MNKYFAGAMIMFAIGASPAAADYAAVESGYVATAFEDADENWFRITGNRISECGVYGKNKKTRAEVLVGRYKSLGAAMASGDQDAAITAASRLGDAINANGRFETCWDKLSRKEGIRSSFKRALEDL